MKKIVPYLLSMVLVVGVFGGAYAWKMTQPEAARYFVSPETPRQSGIRQWEKLIGPPKPIPKPNPALLASIQPVIDQPDKIRYEYTTTDTLQGEDVNYTIEDRRNMAADSAASGTIKILGFATAMATEPPDESEFSEYSDGEASCDTAYFNPDLSPMDEATRAEVLPDERNPKTDVRLNGHRFKIFYNVLGLDRPRVVTQRLIDQHTRESLRGGYSYSSTEQYHWVDYDMHSWRSMPADWVVDIVHGPVQTREIEPVAGACAKFEDVQVRLLKLIQGDAYSWSHSVGNPEQHFEIKMRPDNAQKEALIFYAVSPACLHRSLSLEILDASGNVMKTNDLNGNYQNMGMAEFYGTSLDQIDRIRVVYRPFTRRVILPIDGIPGQPEVNRDIKNLADVRIPYVHFEQSYEMRQVIEQSLQLLDNRFMISSMDNSVPISFPRSYTDVTVGELLDEYVSQYPGCRVYIDEGKGAFDIRPPKTLKQRLDEILRNIKRKSGL